MFVLGFAELLYFHTQTKRKRKSSNVAKFMVWYRLVIWNQGFLTTVIACFLPKNLASTNSLTDFKTVLQVFANHLTIYYISRKRFYLLYVFQGFNDILQYMQFFIELHNWMASIIKTVKVFAFKTFFIFLWCHINGGEWNDQTTGNCLFLIIDVGEILWYLIC